MAGPDQKFDDSAALYFAVAVIGLAAIGWTIFVARTLYSSSISLNCDCEECKEKSKKISKKSSKISRGGIIKLIVLGVLWLLFILLWRSASAIESKDTIFDPYQILGLDTGVTEDEIKKAYRRLSLKFHPDKNPDDPTASDKFSEINKAYEVLTDPAVREKWEKYGNPDGPRGFTLGTALPSWVVEKRFSGIVVAFYVIFLLVVVPGGVYWYWKQSQSRVLDISKNTLSIIFYKLRPSSRFKQIVPLVSMSEEYQKLPLRKSDQPILEELKSSLITKEEQAKWSKVKKAKKTKPGQPQPQQQVEFKLPPFAIKNTILFYSYFDRQTGILDPELRNDLELLIDSAHKIVGATATVTLSYRWLIPTIELIGILQMLTQAIWGNYCRVTNRAANTLMQLPHISDDLCEKLRKQKILTVQKFAEMEQSKREALLKQDLNAQQIAQVETVMKKLPIDVSMTYELTIQDDDIKKGITESSFVTVKIEFSRPSYPCKNGNGPNKDNTPIEAHCPFFTSGRKETWWLILAEMKNNIVIGHAKVESLQDKTQREITFPARFLKPGDHQLKLHLLCDSYDGFDRENIINIKIEKDTNKPMEPVHEEKEDSGSEEDEGLNKKPPKATESDDSDADSDDD